MNRAMSPATSSAGAPLCRSSADLRVVQPGEAYVGMKVDVKYDQGEVYRGTVLEVKKPNGEENKALVIRFGDPRNKLIDGKDDPFVLPDPDVTFPAEGYFACCDCGFTRKTRGAECTGDLCVYGVYGTDLSLSNQHDFIRSCK